MIEVTETNLVQCGYSREHVHSALANVTPTRKHGRGTYYELSTAIRAVMNAGETHKERAARLDADIKQVKLDRMTGEQVNASEIELLVSGMFKRLADAIKTCEELPMKRRRSICRQIREEIQRCNGEVEKCRFEEAIAEGRTKESP